MDNVFSATREWAKKQELETWAQEETTSTNDIAKNESGFDLYLTSWQSSGRGRIDHTWCNSQKGHQLLSTWGFQLSSPPQHITGPLIGLAVYQACHHCWPQLNWSIKAPNDLFLGEKKVGGLLTETITSGADYRLLVGFGFNVLSAPTEVPTAGCLQTALGQSPSQQEWESFLTQLLQHLRKVCSEAVQNKLNEQSRAALLKGLNEYPGLAEKYVRIDQDGNLYTASHKTSWHNL